MLPHRIQRRVRQSGIAFVMLLGLAAYYRSARVPAAGAAAAPGMARSLLSDGELPNAFDNEEILDGAIVFYIMGVVYMFLALAICCDEYFVPALERMADVWSVPNDIAGATLMAAGGSAPELFTSFIGVFIAESNVGFGTIVGSAVFNVLFVFGMCALYSKEVLQLTPWPLFRDATYYLISLSVLAGFFYDKEIQWWEALILFGLYLGYVLLMAYNERLHVWARQKFMDNPKTLEELKADKDWNAKYQKRFLRKHTTFRAGVTSLLMKEVDAKHKGPAPVKENRFKRAAQMVVDINAQAAAEEAGQQVEEEDGGPNLEWPSETKQQVIYVILAPLTYLMHFTIPNTASEKWKNNFVLAFFLSIMEIGFFSYLMVDWATTIGEACGIPSEVMGLTFLAAGTSVPDLLSSVIVARQGEGDMAVSSSIGSNIFDVTVGLPLPWFFKAAITGDPIKVESDSLFTSLLLLVAMLAAVILTIDCSNWLMNRGLGRTMFILYFLFLAQNLAMTDWDAE